MGGSIAPVSNEKRARKKELRRAKVAAQRRAEQRSAWARRAGLSVAVAAAVIGSFLWLRASNNTSLAPNTTTTIDSNVSVGTTQVQADTIAMNRGCPASTAERVNTKSWSTAPAMTIDPAKTYTADVTTTAGTFTITLDAAAAPITVNNFVFLARHHFYDCVIFHRVIPGFVIQGGDPTGTGSGGPGYAFTDELPTGTYPLYSVAMANSMRPNTNGSQFFIVSGASGESLPASYSRFGQVTSGLAAVKLLNNQGNSNPSSNGVPPSVTHRILSIIINES